MAYIFPLILYCISSERISHIHFQCIFVINIIKKVKALTANYPADVPLKYISLLMERLLSLIPLKHLKCFSNSRPK